MTDRELMRQALDALEAMQSYAAAENKGLRICDEAIEALRARLAQPEPERYPVLNGRHINNESKLWMVFCVNCKKQWPVPYPHSGKSICAECEKKRNADYQGNDWTQNDSEYNK